MPIIELTRSNFLYTHTHEQYTSMLTYKQPAVSAFAVRKSTHASMFGEWLAAVLASHASKQKQQQISIHLLFILILSPKNRIVECVVCAQKRYQSCMFLCMCIYVHIQTTHKHSIQLTVQTRSSNHVVEKSAL